MTKQKISKILSVLLAGSFTSSVVLTRNSTNLDKNNSDIDVNEIENQNENDTLIDIAILITGTDRNMGNDLLNEPSEASIKAYVNSKLEHQKDRALWNEATLTKESSKATIRITNSIEYTGTLEITWGLAGKKDLSVDLLNKVVEDGSVTDDKTTLKKGSILRTLGIQNSGLNVEHLNIDFEKNPPQHVSIAGGSAHFWYLTVTTSEYSDIYNPSSVVINVISRQLSLSEYVRNTDLGTLEVKENGSVDVDKGPQKEDIRSKLKKQNINIDDDFIDHLTINEATRVGDAPNLYEYQATVECNKEYSFIKPNSTVVVNFYGIQNSYLAYKLKGVWKSSFDIYSGPTTGSTTKDGSSTTGYIADASTSDKKIITINDAASEGIKEGYAKVVLPRTSYDTVVCLKKDWPIMDSDNIPVTNLLHRYCEYNNEPKFDISGLAFNPIPAVENPDNPVTYISDIHAGVYTVLILGDLLPENVNFNRLVGPARWTPDEPALDIYCRAMDGGVTLTSGTGPGADVKTGTPYMNPVVNLHLPYGSKYQLKFTDYVGPVFDWFDTPYGPGTDNLAPTLTVTYDYNGDVE